MTPTVTAENTSIVRERQFSNRMEIEVVIQMLRESQSTGVLCVHLSQGGVGAMTFKESHKIIAK